MITETLQQIGLTENESKIYYLLLEFNELPTSLLAKKLKKNKGNIHWVCESLMKKGIIRKSKRNNVAYYCPEKPSSIHQFLKLRLEAAKDKFIQDEEKLDNILAFLERQYKKPSQLRQSKVFYYEGFDQVCKSYMKFYEHLKDETTVYSYAFPATLDERGLENMLKKTIQKRLSKNIHCKLIATYSKEAARLKLTDHAENRETLIAFKGEKFTMSETILSTTQTLDAFYTPAGIASSLTINANNALIQTRLFQLAWKQAKLEDKEHVQSAEFVKWLEQHRPV